MLLITCHCCGATADETDFHCGGEAHIQRPTAEEATEHSLGAYLFDRKNPKGLHAERWRHQYGCGKWFHMLRDTRTLEIYGVYAITETAPPPELLAKARAKLAAAGLPETSTR